MSSRVLFLALCALLLMTSSAATTLSYTVYTQSGCTSTSTSGSVGVTTFSGNSSGVTCATLSPPIYGNSYGSAGCNVGNAFTNTLSLYNDSACNNLNYVFQASGNGVCANGLSVFGQPPTNYSATISCSSAVNTAYQSITVISLLAIIASLMM